MMARKRRKYPAELKARVALEALREEQPITQIASRYGVHANLVTNWKRQARESLVDVFSGSKERHEASHEHEVKDLQAKIGQLVVERDFLQKALGR